MRSAIVAKPPSLPARRAVWARDRSAARAGRRQGPSVADRPNEAGAIEVAKSIGGEALAVTSMSAAVSDVGPDDPGDRPSPRRIDILVKTTARISASPEPWKNDRRAPVGRADGRQRWRSVFLCSKHAIPVMAAGGGGAIVNMGSYAASVGIPNRAAYVASKVGIRRAHPRDGARPRQAEHPRELRRARDYRHRLTSTRCSPSRTIGIASEGARCRVADGPHGQARRDRHRGIWLASDEASSATGTGPHRGRRPAHPPGDRGDGRTTRRSGDETIG